MCVYQPPQSARWALKSGGSLEARVVGLDYPFDAEVHKVGMTVLLQYNARAATEGLAAGTGGASAGARRQSLDATDGAVRTGADGGRGGRGDGCRGLEKGVHGAERGVLGTGQGGAGHEARSEEGLGKWVCKMVTVGQRYGCGTG